MTNDLFGGDIETVIERSKAERCFGFGLGGEPSQTEDNSPIESSPSAIIDAVEARVAAKKEAGLLDIDALAVQVGGHYRPGLEVTLFYQGVTEESVARRLLNFPPLLLSAGKNGHRLNIELLISPERLSTGGIK